MSSTPTADAGMQIVLRALRPLSPGTIGGDGFGLESIETTPAVRLSFRGPRGARFAIRFQQSAVGARFFATTGRLDLILDTEEQPSRAVEEFVRRLAPHVGRNTADMSDAELAWLARAGDAAGPGVGREAMIHPALRRRAKIGAANLLDINVGDGCNLSCTFCTDVDSRGRHLFRPTSFWIEELPGRAKGARPASSSPATSRRSGPTCPRSSPPHAIWGSSRSS